MRNTRRRGLRLASVLIASGLAVTVAPAVHAAGDDGSLMTLTDSQAEQLAQRLTPDVYGDGRSLGDPLEAAEDAEEKAGTDALADGAADATTGASTQATTGASTTATPKWKLTRKSDVEGAQGMAATFPVGGADGDYFSVNGLSPVQRIGADGKQLWSRGAASLDSDWRITPTFRGPKEPYPPAVVMGFNAVSPFTMATDDGVATGDLTGDGVDDIVFTAEVGVNPYRPFTSPGSSLPNGTFVTILDGATGKTLWSKLYAAAYNVKLVGTTLVVADSAFYNLNSPAGSKATLNGIRFDHADGRLTPVDSWSYDAGTYRGVQWGSLEPIGDGLLAASWNQAKRYAPDGSPSGHTLVIDTTDGSVKWNETGRLYVRQLRLDAARGRIVALEQSDHNEGVKYEIAAYDPADGTRTGLTERINALPLALEIGDVQGGSKPEYTVSESTLDNGLWMNSNSVRALNGDDASLLWAHTVKRSAIDGDVDAAWGIKAVDGKIVASYLDSDGRETAENRAGGHYARIIALGGGNGAVKWDDNGIVGSVMFAQPFRKGDGWRLRTVDTNQNVRVYNTGNGRQTDLQPLEGVPVTAAATDVDGDGKNDVVLGGSSNALFAYDGPSMVAGKPEQLWKTTLPGRVVQVVKADTDGDGRDELIVADSSATVVVDARTGKILTTIDAAQGEYVRNVVASDLDGDGAAEIAVATDEVRAYEGDGTPKWEYAVPSEIGTPAFADLSAADGKVYAQFQTRGGDPTAARAVGGVGLNGKDGTTAWTFTPKAPDTSQGAVLGIPLRAGTFASSRIPYADGHAVVFTYVVRGNAQQLPPNQLTNMVQIRDGRTGELLHEAKAGGYATLANWSTEGDLLVENSLASLRAYAADGVDHKNRALAEVRGGSFATGPDGARVLVRSGTQFVALYDPSVLTGSVDYPPLVNGYDVLGARENFVADLDDDGKDEIIALPFDEYGTDLAAGLVGNKVAGTYTAIRSATTLTIDKG
ncbi:VCBS repeat-containing protein [Streptomyces sp. NK15101]|uniref:FG-GAP repeat domain-containing protein n=1 Tax=Streptomyces sp. NK15101 TaxID=2873261 RepID=UPI001CEDDCEB|nr:FG-GAP-like repeat-containing protein [Streptomyces sp. NK15101]